MNTSFPKALTQVSSLVISSQHKEGLSPTDVKEIVKPYVYECIPNELLEGLKDEEVYTATYTLTDKAGNTNTSQQMMRWRVIAQGATVIAIISGALPNIMAGSENKKSIEQKNLLKQELY